MSQNFIIFLWLKWIKFKMNRTCLQASFNLKLIFLNTDFRYNCTIYEIRNPGIKQPNKRQILLTVRRFEKMWSVQWLLRGILLIQWTLSLMRRTSFWCTLFFVVFFKIMLNLSKTYKCETVKIYIIHSYENAFNFLLNRSNQKLLKQ